LTGFGQDLLRWFSSEGRDLPWRRQRDPYTTWVSEVMLQQTTVDVVAPRFDAFLARFPTVESLALAAEGDVLAAWAGLGYYRRARALHAGARTVVERFGGLVPDDVAALRGLPGIGEYTAAAIVSLAYDRPAAAVDGNVARVSARLFAESGDIGQQSVRRRLGERLLDLAPRDRAGAFNEALIELGALVCRPRVPACGTCPVARHCAALEEARVHDYPKVKARRATVAVDAVRVLVERGGTLLLSERPTDASLLPGFLELPGRWGPEGEDPVSAARDVLRALGFDDPRMGEMVAETRHAITHHRIRSRAVAADVDGSPRAPARFHPRDTLDPRRLTTETRKLLSRLEVSL
jgi:A/G-specific adenine glycosylase